MTRLEDPLISSIDDCFMSVNIDNSLMSEQQLHDLNPLTIKIEKATSLPNKPLSYESLRDQCEKVYCSYNFLNKNPTKHRRFPTTRIYSSMTSTYIWPAY